MATYNGERFLQEQLDSLARQSLAPLELVACDDASSDGTLDILQMFAAKAPFPVRVYQNETRLGYGLNFLRAASLCTGSLIAFCDQDDVWVKQKLQRCTDVIADTGSKLIIHSAEVVDKHLASTGRRTMDLRSPVCIDPMADRRWVPLDWRVRMIRGCTCVFHSSLLSEIPPRPPLSGPRVGHEYWMSFAAEATGTVTLLPDALMLYRQHEHNVVGSRRHTQRGWWLGTDAAEYQSQADASSLCAEILADAAKRLPGELQPRLSRARGWYEARSRSLARRAALYSGGPSFAAAVRRLPSMVAGGVYKSPWRGGVGIRSLAKDVALPILPQAFKEWWGSGSNRAVASGMQKSE